MTRCVLALLLVTATAHAAPVDWAEVESIPGADALLVTGDSTHVIARINGSWFVTTEPLGLLYDLSPTVRRAFDATLLAKRPAIAIVVESYDGGSGMGTAIDQLIVLCAEKDQLQVCGEMQIGRLEWSLDAEHRSKFPDGAFSLRKRPHVEVVLEPTLVAPDMLRLAVTRSSNVASPDGPWSHETLATMDALRRSAGHYRLVGGEFVRID